MKTKDSKETVRAVFDYDYKKQLTQKTGVDTGTEFAGESKETRQS